MAWFGRRSKGRSEAMGNDPPPGIHRSPGLAALFADLASRRDPAVLDMGASSTENLAFFSEVSSNVTIQDLFRSSGGAVGQRSSAFRFSDAAQLSLPDDRWDAIVLWDLIHYVERDQLPAFGERLAGICRPGGVLYLLASATTRIPPVPLQFRILGRDRLGYEIDREAPVEAPQFRAREIEAMLGRFEPQRLFQLRNGLLEMLFVRRDDGPSEPVAADGGNKEADRGVGGGWSSVPTGQ